MRLLFFRRLIRHHFLSIAGILAISLLVLSIFISYFPYTRLDIELAQLIQSIRAPLLTWYLIAISWLGNPMPTLILMTITLVGIMLTPMRLLFFPLLLIIPADAFSFGWKLIIERPRPSLPYVEVLSSLPDPSFPSLHVVHFFVFFGFLGAVCFHQWMYSKKKRLLIFSLLCLSFVLLIPISRVYVGAHWPTDVVGGMLVGICFLVFQLKVYQLLFRKSAR